MQVEYINFLFTGWFESGESCMQAWFDYKVCIMEGKMDKITM